MAIIRRRGNRGPLRIGRLGEAAVFIFKAFLSELWIPVCVLFDHGVENDEQFSHTGHEDDFRKFALSFQSIGGGATV